MPRRICDVEIPIGLEGNEGSELIDTVKLIQ